MTICNFCGKDKKLINSHILPKCFFNDEKLVVINSEKKAFKTFPKNAFREKLFCKNCDSSFSNLEQYAYDFFYKHIPANKKTYSLYGKPCYKITNFNYDKLRKFFILMSYRIHLSSSIYFNLHEYEYIATDLLKNDSFIPNLFVPEIEGNESEIISVGRIESSHINNYPKEYLKFNTIMFNQNQLLIPINTSFNNISAQKPINEILSLPQNKAFVEKDFAEYKASLKKIK